MRKTKLKIQRATGAAVELHQFENIKWQDYSTTYGGMTFAEAKRELEELISFTQECDDESLDHNYELAKDDARNIKAEDLFGEYGAIVIIEGAEKAFRIVED